MSVTKPVKELTLKRQIAAPVDAIWRAWTDPVEWQQWMGPVGWTIADCSIDLRVGGKWTTTQRSPDGTLHPTGGRYLVIEPPHHLGFSWILEDAEGKVVLDAEHHLRLTPKGDGTEVSLEVRILTALPGSEAFTNGVRDGWTGGLSKLAAYVEE